MRRIKSSYSFSKTKYNSGFRKNNFNINSSSKKEKVRSNNFERNNSTEKENTSYSQGKNIKIKNNLNKKDINKERSKSKNNVTDKGETPIPTGKNNSIYIGKEDFGEENEIINELKKNYYKDVMDMNKNNCYNCHDKYNITCILMKLTHELYPVIEVTTDDGNKVDEKIKDNNIQNIKIEQ